MLIHHRLGHRKQIIQPVESPVVVYISKFLSNVYDDSSRICNEYIYIYNIHI